MKSFWFNTALRLVHVALGLLIDHRAARAAASPDSTAAPELPATAAPAPGI